MASIAYITDSKMLDNHRLNQNKTMNFWRLSTKVKFASFGLGGLVFFLSKNKEHYGKDKEKGIIGFGRLTNIFVGSPLAMWTKFTRANGYNSYDEFLEAIKKFNKKEETPKTISSLYLENVCFFQTPVYLSECGMDISKNVESFIYISDEATKMLLQYGKEHIDIWSCSENQEELIDEETIGVSLSIAHDKIKDIRRTKDKITDIQNKTKDYLDNYPIYRRIHGSYANIYNVYKDNVTLVMYHDKDTDMKSLVGQAIMYKKLLDNEYMGRLSYLIKTIDDDQEFLELVN